ncbi:hypothetical protein E2562_001191 [Oryza meyeriana var. granulata]|uniref:Uncharacterized protein n=1 Tax=Oryza meyeriana var. granulata TaxID=110450 RepID=A0A6G1DCN4_9ORYZ|nr:hypothetical protein E2562_001191 [Oryza meyeriana var. granulata]
MARDTAPPPQFLAIQVLAPVPPPPFHKIPLAATADHQLPPVNAADDRRFLYEYIAMPIDIVSCSSWLRELAATDDRHRQRTDYNRITGAEDLERKLLPWDKVFLLAHPILI